MAENEVVQIKIHKILYRKTGKRALRVWATLTNKTSKNVTASYGNFKLIINGKTYPGALRVPFARVHKTFPLSPNMVKKIPGPIESEHVPMANEATLTLDNIKVDGASGTYSISVTFPFAPPESK